MESLVTSQTARPEEELQYIRKIIEDSRANFAQSGEPYIVWGLIVAIGMGLSYLSILLQRDLYTGYIWIGLILFGWGSMIYYYRKRRNEEPRAKTIIGRIDGAVWGACGGTIGLIVILFMSNYQYDPVFGAISPLLICFFSAMVMAIAFFVSGVVNQIRWLRNISFAWWAASVLMLIFSSSIHIIGIYSLMLLFFQVVPGIILQRRYKRITSQVPGA